MKFLKKLKRWISFQFFHLMYLFFSIHPLKEKQVCFLSDVRQTVGGNFKYVYDQIKNQDYHIIFELKANRHIQRTIQEMIQLAYHLALSKYIFLDDYSTIINHITLRKQQHLIQLWHGAGAFKKFGFSRANTDEPVGKIHPGYKKYTQSIVSSEAVRWCFAEAFSISIDKVKATGVPRTDIFFDEDYMQHTTEQFYQQYPQFKNKKIILFAPTWRGIEVSDAYYDLHQLDFDDLYQKLHHDYVFFIKWHPAIYNNIQLDKMKNIDFTKYPDFYFDFSKYRDINDLLIVCDCLITDYSSVIFDYVLLNKPIIYYTYDLNQYIGNGGRGLYFDFDEYIYGPVAINYQQLVDCIRENDLMDEERKIFVKKFMSACDGHATQKTCEWIFNNTTDVQDISKEMS